MNRIITGLALIIPVILLSGCIETGKGHTTDTVHSIERSGLFCKTWKVFLTNDHPTDYNEATYSIHPSNIKVIETLQEAYKNGKKVTLEYHTELGTLGCFDELNSGYAIIDIAEIVQ